MKKRVLIIFCLIGIFNANQAFSQTITGYVIDKNSGERLPNVNVYSLDHSLFAESNEYGYFSLSLKKCPCDITFSYVGYETKSISFDLGELNKFQTIELEILQNTLEEVVITAKDKDKQQIGLISISVERLKKVPAIFGEVDVLKALTLTPGVSTGTEGTAGVLVRGGSPDQNLILLDETPVYNVTHLFGLVSVFNPDAIKDVKLYKAGFPARYGGRLSSVIDITSKEGSSKKNQKEFTFGLINSRILLEGPLSNRTKKDYGTYLIAARLTNLSLLLLPTYINYKLNVGEQFLNYNLFDLNLKWNRVFKDYSQLLFSSYSGNDVWYVKSNNGNATGKYRVNWGNVTGSVRYIKPLGQKVFIKNTAAYSFYGYGLRASLKQEESNEDFIDSRSTLNDLTLKSTVEIYPNSRNELQIGGELTAHSYSPVNIKSSYDIVVQDNKSVVKALEKAAFVAYIGEFTKWLNVQTGVRLANFTVQDTAYNSIEPRLSIVISPFKKTSFKVGFSKMGQFLHLLNSSSGGLPNDLWIPATKELPFERSTQISIGISKELSDSWKLDFDIYKKDHNNLIDYKSGQNFIINSETNYQNLVEKNGIGESYGFEVFLDKSKGRLTGWLAYTHANNYRKFDNINSGKWYAANFDRRHVFNVTTAFNMNKKIDLSANWVFQSGTPMTVPIATHSEYIINGNPRPNYIYGDRNNFRNPVYHRLDVNSSFKKRTKRGNQRILSVGVYNLYNHNNSFYLNTERKTIYNIDRSLELGWDINITKNNFLPFLPYISYSLKFL